jgi:comEA protein
MQFFTFTAQETKALIFLLAALAVGSGITLYKRSHPRFAPQMVIQSTQSPAAPRMVDVSGRTPGRRALIDINRAAAEELELLPGIGPALSRRVVEYRQINGPFATIEDITRVQGIGPKTFQRIKGYISAGPDTAEISP